MASQKRYGKLPPSANSEAIEPFTFNIPDAELTRLNTLLQLSTIAAENYENTYADKANQFGLTREWLVAAKDRWENGFDWRQREDLVNSFPNFKAAIPVPVDGSPSTTTTTINIHFTALFSSNPSAVPIVFLHGWPGSFFEFLPLLNLLRDKYPDEASLPYHVVVPSLPGYGLSDPPPKQRNFTTDDATWMMDHLLTKSLGFTAYVAQGGDVGAYVAHFLARGYPACKGLHLNFPAVPAPPDFAAEGLDDAEREGLQRNAAFGMTGASHALWHAVRPATAGLVIMASPLAMLAWLGEKFLYWTDPASFPNSPKDPEAPDGEKLPYSVRLMDEAIAESALYYLTGCASTSLYPYRDLMARGRSTVDGSSKLIAAPKIFGYSWFRRELMMAPKEWMAKVGNLVFYKRHDKGGHFAALEQPAALLEDVEEFASKLVKA
ncbi:alpha/beta-hydrolase [Trichoderma longibrachiatum]|uniref:Alpha/beta-hydrolase n=1 Tax=Trichoderma longibrachiatum ATCC 18648 TaxID=983965 RepID=A0A2T4C8G0_TRILO|nr:alpha/beta-hydrolase [Trichoderma longibrachiatum ATCC 18648]